MTVIISLPVHERPEVVVDQLANIHRYMPNSSVIVHISKGFAGNPQPIIDFASKVRDQQEVIVNPERLDTAWAGMIQTHLSNFRYARKFVPQFTTFALHASNDMFVRLGAEQYIQAAERDGKQGAQVHVAPVEMQWSPRHCAEHDTQLKAMMNHMGVTEMRASQVEGTFYDRLVFSNVVNVIDRFFDVSKIAQYRNKDIKDTVNRLYPREELYFSTLTHALVGEGSFTEPYLLNEPWTGNVITEDTVKMIRESTLPDSMCWETRIFQKAQRLNEPASLYAVKRVARNLNDRVRRYINQT